MNDAVTMVAHSPIMTLTLNQPERQNRLNPDLLTILLRRLTEVRQHHGLRAVVLQANGESFSEGTDLAELVAQIDRVAYADHVLRLLHQVMLACIELPVPLIAAVQGPVSGSAIGLVLVADVVLVTPKTCFTSRATTFGLCPEGGWTVLLPRLIGYRRTTEILLLERPITAEEAVTWGLANRLVASGHLPEEAQALAHQIATQMPGSVAWTRRLLWAERDQIIAELHRERELFCTHMRSIEADIGLKAFLDRQRAIVTTERES